MSIFIRKELTSSMSPGTLWGEGGRERGRGRGKGREGKGKREGGEGEGEGKKEGEEGEGKGSRRGGGGGGGSERGKGVGGREGKGAEGGGGEIEGKTEVEERLDRGRTGARRVRGCLCCASLTCWRTLEHILNKCVSLHPTPHGPQCFSLAGPRTYLNIPSVCNPFSLRTVSESTVTTHGNLPR